MAKNSLSELTEVVSLSTWSNDEVGLNCALENLRSLQSRLLSRGCLQHVNDYGLTQPIIDLTLLVPGNIGLKIELVAVVLKGKK